MNAEDQNQDFEKLQHLLKLKRYEQPPPRYFHDFSSQVVSRIRGRAPGGRFESFDDVVSQTPWLRRLWHTLEGRPAISGVLAAAVCGVLVAAAFLMDGAVPQNVNFLATDDGNTRNGFAPAPGLGNSFAIAPQLASSTNTAALLTGPNLFDRLPTIQTVPVSGTPR